MTASKMTFLIDSVKHVIDWTDLPGYHIGVHCYLNLEHCHDLFISKCYFCWLSTCRLAFATCRHTHICASKYMCVKIQLYFQSFDWHIYSGHWIGAIIPCPTKTLLLLYLHKQTLARFTKWLFCGHFRYSPSFYSWVNKIIASPYLAES